MRFHLIGEGPFKALRVDLDSNEIVKAEYDALVSRSATVFLNSRLEGGCCG